MIFRHIDQFLSEGTPKVTRSCLLLRAGPACVPFLGASSRWIFKVCGTEVTAASLGNLLLSLIVLVGNILLLSSWNFPACSLWLFPHASCLMPLRDGSDSVLAETAHTREQVCVWDVRMWSCASLAFPSFGFLPLFGYLSCCFAEV